MTSTSTGARRGREQVTTLTGPTYQLAEFMNRNWDEMVGRTNIDVAIELGYRAPNMVSMWRTGKTRIPLERLPDIARLMKVDLGALLPMWAEQQLGDRPDTKSIMADVISRVCTRNELTLLEKVRAVGGSRLDPFYSKEQIDAVVAVIQNPDARAAALASVTPEPETKAPAATPAKAKRRLKSDAASAES